MSTAHTVFDEASLKRQEEGLAREKTDQAIKDKYLEQMAHFNSASIHDQHHIDQQSGRALKAEEWEARLRKVLPTVKFDTNRLTPAQCRSLHLIEGSTTRRAFVPVPVSEENPNGFMYVGAWQNFPLVPEFSVILTRDHYMPAPWETFKDVRLPDTGQWVKMPHLDRKDVRLVKDENGNDVLAPGDQPGRKLVKEQCGQLIGWRTVLAAAVLKGLVSPEAVEREFGGAADNATWALRMGRQNVETPF